jgi:hypothetical protein
VPTSVLAADAGWKSARSSGNAQHGRPMNAPGWPVGRPLRLETDSPAAAWGLQQRKPFCLCPAALRPSDEPVCPHSSLPQGLRALRAPGSATKSAPFLLGPRSPLPLLPFPPSQTCALMVTPACSPASSLVFSPFLIIHPPINQPIERCKTFPNSSNHLYAGFCLFSFLLPRISKHQPPPTIPHQRLDSTTTSLFFFKHHGGITA